MYQPYPSGGQPQQLPSTTPPQSVQNAVRLMYGGAVLSAIQFVLGFLTIGSLRSTIIKAANQQHRHLTQSQIHTAEVFGVTTAIAVGLLGVGLWIWMARVNGKGRRWARVVASVLFALNTLSVLSAVRQPHVGLGIALDGLIWLVGLGAIILLWQRASTDYYNANSERPM